MEQIAGNLKNKKKIVTRSGLLTRLPFSRFKKIHNGETIIVCGCGNSLTGFKSPENIITIGVNDVGRLFDPDYLVVLNPRNQFKGDRFQYVASSKAKVLFTQLNLGIRHSNIVCFKLGPRGGTDCFSSDSLPFTRNSPYVALCLAMYMGAKRIGLIGVDFTEHHFFAKSGKHALSSNIKIIDKEYQALYETAQSQGVEIVNLSSESKITAFPKSTFDDFYSNEHVFSINEAVTENQKQKSLKIVSYSTMPVAGVPEILSSCINKHTHHECRCVWASSDYGNGVSFNSDIEWKQQPQKAAEVIKRADLVIVHNGKVASQHKALLKNKAVVTMAHNYIWNVDQAFVKQGYPGVVVAQYQATLAEFSDWTAVPNPVFLEGSTHSVPSKNSKISICYTPSGKHDVYPRNHRLYWHSKGYATTMDILKKLSKKYPITLEVIKDKQLSHKQVLAMKSRSHIVIDECVTGSYHRNSLEGLANACVVINGMGILPEVDSVFSGCTNGGQSPFIGCTLAQLESVLVELLEKGRETLLEEGLKNKSWLEQNWSFSSQWQHIWLPEIEKALHKRITDKQNYLSNDKARVHSAIKINEKVKTRTTTQAPALKKTTASNRLRLTKSGQKNIPVYWTCRQNNRGNFGDMLSPVLTRALSGKKAVFTTHGSRLFAVGSLIKFARQGDVIWGTGFINEADKCKRGVIVKAVRGPLTRDRLIQQGIECPEVYGDPGLLLPVLYPPKNIKRNGIGIIPHYVDYKKVRVELSAKGFRVIDIRAGVEKVLQAVMQCEIIISSSLHGCILGESYGIPTVWVEISDKVVGKGFKFRDYYASTDRDPVHIDWRKNFDIDKAVNVALSSSKPNIDLLPLFDSFPCPYANINELRSRVAQQSLTLSQSSTEANINSIPVLRESMVEKTITEKRMKDKIAVFGAVTENYAEYMIASMRSFMKHNDDSKYDYFILGSTFSARTQRIIRKFSIQYININLNRQFTRNIRHRYPGECFWIFKGPEIFASKGYRYSLSIDGDTLCNKPLDTKWLPELKHIAGVNRGCDVRTFLSNLKQLETLKKKFLLEEDVIKRPATNSGVIFYNNIELSKINFYQRMVETYQNSERLGIIRGGDDSTLALFLGLNPDVDLYILENSWNVYRGISSAGNEASLNIISRESYILHLSSLKPWKYHINYPNALLKNAIEEWRTLWTNSKNQRRMKSLERIKQNGVLAVTKKIIDRDRIRAVSKARTARKIAKSLSPELYWYRGRTLNMGDEITPYLMGKILNLESNDFPAKPIKDPARAKSLVFLSVGSIMRLCGSNTIVWGSGIRNIDQPIKKAAKFCAVRGPLTRRRLLQLGYNCPEVYGDPAVLLPKYFFPEVTKKYKLGIIPHSVDLEGVEKRYGNDKECLIIDVNTGNIEFIVSQILSCECTVSSSLHGLILSASYGVPTKWIKCSDKIMGDDTKFYDYFASLNSGICDVIDYRRVSIPGKNDEFEPYRPLLLHKHYPDLRELILCTYKHEQTLDIEVLEEAFPRQCFSRLR